MSKKIKITDVMAWFAENLPEDAAAGLTNYLTLATGATIPTGTLSGGDDDAAADEDKGTLFVPEGEEADFPWAAYDKPAIVALGAALEIEGTKPKEIRPALETLWATKRGKAAILTAINGEEEEAPAKGKGKGGKGKAAETEADAGDEINISLDGVSKAALKTAKAGYKGYDDSMAFNYLNGGDGPAYDTTGGLTTKKPAGALELAIKADALYADLEAHDEDALEAVCKSNKIKAAVPKGARGDAKKEALIRAIVKAAIDA